MFAALSGVISSHDDQCASVCSFINAYQNSIYNTVYLLQYGIRLVELLVILITEGRDAMCKTYTMKLCTSGGDTSDQGTSTKSQYASVIQSYDIIGAFNRTQRHLIDLIRHRDTDTLIDIIESEEVL